MRPYQPDLRHRILNARSNQIPDEQITKLFQISQRTLERYTKQHRETGSLQPGQTTGRTRKLSPEQEQALAEQCDAYPEDTLEQYRQRLNDTHGVQVSRSTISRALARLKRTRKKDGSRR
jgi:transposase